MRVGVANIQIVSHSVVFLSIFVSSRLVLEEIAACGCLVSKALVKPLVVVEAEVSVQAAP